MDLTFQYKKTLSDRLRENSPLIQVLVGPRQVGKSTAANEIFTSWTGSKHSVSADSHTPLNASWIREQWDHAKRLGHGTLLIIDEIQKVQGWSEAVKALSDPDRGTGSLKVLLLGSSSLNLRRGASESLAGRFELLDAPHWSFQAFHQVFGWDFDRFMRFGAYPGAALFANDERRWRDYVLNSIVEPILSRDILGQVPVSKPALFRQTFELAVKHPAHILSLNKLLGQLQESGNVSTIKNYLELFKYAFLLLPIERFSGSSLKVKGSSPKIVVLNPALIHAFVPQKKLDEDPSWRGFVIESMMGAAFARERDTHLYYWREGNDEVDYVLESHNSLRAIEIKSGPRIKGRGITKFQKKFPHAICETWDFRRCMDYLGAM